MSSWTSRARGLVLSLAAAVSTVALVPTQADAESCSAQCDSSCQTCCSHWIIRATCGSETREDGDYGTYSDALDAADHQTTVATNCSGSDPACAKAKLTCSGDPSTSSHGVASWAAVCRGAALKPKEADALASSISDGKKSARASDAMLVQASATLVSFTQDHVLTKTGEASVATAAEGVRAAHAQVDASLNEGELLRASGAGGDALTTWRAHVDVAATKAKQASDAIRGLANDPAVVNAAADEKNRRAREAVETLRAKLASLQHTARDMREQVTTAQSSIGDSAPGALKALGRDLTRESAVWTTLAEKERAQDEVDPPSAPRVADLDSQSQRLTKQTQATLAAVEAARSGASSTPLNPPPPTPVVPTPPTPKPPPIKPAAPAFVVTQPAIATCTVSFVPEVAGTKISVTVDGGHDAPLPTQLKLSSGRHIVVATRGGTSQTKSELILCNRTSALTVESPR